MANTRAPRLEKAIAYLQSLVKEAAEQKQTRLPSVKSMSEETGFSSVTVCKAIGILKSRGVLSAAQRKGIHVIPESVNASFELSALDPGNPRPRLSRWQKTRDALVSDIVSGAITGDRGLPHPKELARRYGICQATMRKVLENLEHRGRILHEGRTYRVQRPAILRTHARLFVVTREALLSGRTSEFWHALERECSRLNLTPERVFFPDALARLRSGERAIRSAAGYFVMAHEGGFDELHNTLLALSRTLRPVAVLDDVGKVTIPSVALSNPLMRLFVMSIGSEPGKVMGRYLFGLGHRRIGFFAAFKNDLWSLNRYKGLCEAWQAEGLSSGVTAFAEDHFAQWSAIQSLTTGSRPYAGLRTRCLDIQRTVNPETNQDPDAFYVNSQRCIWGLEVEKHLRPLFGEALKDRSITAWVGENDDAGRMAMRFLARRKIDVPGWISVAGFDNSVEAMTEGLTSLDFNVPAVVNAMLEFVLAVRSARSNRNKGPLEIPGIIMQRKSSGEIYLR